VHKRFFENCISSYAFLAKDVPFEFNEECLTTFRRLKGGIDLCPNYAGPELGVTF